MPGRELNDQKTRRLTFKICLEGRVQGVGFRPLVYKLATQHGIHGVVRNGSDGVQIACNVNKSEAEQFLQLIIDHAPKEANIKHTSIHEIDSSQFDGFRIVKSNKESNPTLSITPDFALCDACRQELHEPTNRRHNYPFITCTICGPRYSITSDLPFDRENTSMADFTMCKACSGEYELPGKRRHHSQTNSCHDCGISLTLYNRDSVNFITHEPLQTIVSNLEEGAVVAVKGIGGFLLLCDATNAEAISRLRERKQRPTKPFAVMYPSLPALRNEVYLTDFEANALQSSAAPIVLLRQKQPRVAVQHIAPNMNTLGVMLPYAPLFELILSTFNKPVVATSGNLSGSPIVYENQQAIKELGAFADMIVCNNREIIVPQDDSVIRFSEKHNQRIILRRSRGYAPANNVQLAESPHGLVAFGASLKSSFSFNNHQNTITSQFLGDTASYHTQQSFKHTLMHLLSLYELTPSAILIDKHPGYFTHRYGVEMAEQLNVPVRQFQHHKAHFAAVLAEKNLLNSDNKVLGVIWDGTGLGDDGRIWGGEFFTYERSAITRVNHLDYYPQLMGDKMAKQPRLSALALLHDYENVQSTLQSKFSKTEWRLYNKSAQNTQMSTSSMGRLFDAVASITGIANNISFEGEAAMLLEQKAAVYLSKHNVKSGYAFTDGNHLSPKQLLSEVVEDHKNGLDNGHIAAKFHITLVDMIRHVAVESNTPHLAFSGGVFQNALLVDLIIDRLSPDYSLYFHRELPPNDENISFGQLVMYQLSATVENNFKGSKYEIHQ